MPHLCVNYSFMKEGSSVTFLLLTQLTGKTFLLKPLEQIFKTFCNPANDKYAWVGSDEVEVILLQDFRWSSELISWKDLFLLLEEEIVKHPSPKNHYAKDVCINIDIPVFAASKGPIEYVGKYYSVDSRENEMMAVRWKIFQFHHQIPQVQQLDIPPC